MLVSRDCMHAVNNILNHCLKSPLAQNVFAANKYLNWMQICRVPLGNTLQYEYESKYKTT